MKNKEVVRIVRLLGSIGLNTRMFILNKSNERIEVGALVVTDKVVFVCAKKGNESMPNANSYIKEIEDKKIENLLSLDVKVYLGSASELIECKDTLDKEKIKEIKSICYHKNVFDFTINE